ncbi:Phenol hydroxylase P1 protein [Solimonas aquatica]|uniref:Phenol hydroxylase P1 protein n=1 Tax=Solimonas aquatica TaxID=489703 RepID=A0A1H9BI87_9GAMM|nr:aromatic/alkene monooxygenase hydroxylase subunit beta [Solimonas aquatica]SEP88333.1 Phenol hydroxylase P1 protein [Solimonas aquatica]
MQIDLRTVTIKPLRQTFDHVAAKIGGDKPATRYQEGTIGLQAENNFHYRPLWAPEYEIFDKRRTDLKMKDWYAFKDPRQFYYGSYTINRARMQEAAAAEFEFAEERDLGRSYPAAAKRRAIDVLLPLRHVAWGSNMNNSFCAAYGYGTAITQPCLYQAMDQLGIAQYLTRIGLLLDQPEVLDTAKQAWMESADWQPLRHAVEDMLVTQDWFELFMAQNFVLDGLLFPLIYQRVADSLAAEAGLVLSMLTRFQVDWYAETSKWVDASVKTAVAESSDNQALVSDWTRQWLERSRAALAPVAKLGLGAGSEAALSEVLTQFKARAARLGVTI